MSRLIRRDTLLHRVEKLVGAAPFKIYVGTMKLIDLTDTDVSVNCIIQVRVVQRWNGKNLMGTVIKRDSFI